METMLALVKKEAKPGLWLDNVPVPRIGFNDVLIKVLRKGFRRHALGQGPRSRPGLCRPQSRGSGIRDRGVHGGKG